MALSPQALIKGVIARALGTVQSDSPNADAPVRLLSYGEVAVQPVVRKAHLLADEGSYYVTNNAQSGIATTYGTSIAATSPFILVQNQTLNRLYLDYITLTAQTAGACTTAVGYIAAGIVIDNIIRYVSGGTNLTPNLVSPNMAAGAPGGVQVYCGAIVAAAASAAARTLVGIRNIRPGVSSTIINVAGDVHLLNFGGVEGAMNGNIVIANPNLIPTPLPPVVIGPGHSALIYLWYPLLTAPSAATFVPEIGLWVR